MVRLIRTALAVLNAVAVLGAPRVAQADTPTAEARREASRPVPPVLREAPVLGFPEDARAAGVLSGVVVLRVTVEADGSVTSADVVEPGGYGFDAIAQSAAFAHRFEPARRDGAAIRVRVLLRLEFHAPEAPAIAGGAAPVANAARPNERSVAQPAVTVLGLSRADQLRRSAEAVKVIEIEEAKRQTADLGEVLARSEGVGVQRSAGLGSNTRVSLNGMTDDQIRFFLDGIPLEFAGYPFGVSNVPVNLVERVEIYRGVVPIRFGADALGGAVNLVSERDRFGTRGAISTQVGSFGTYRVTLNAEHLDKPTGWFSRVNAFLDRAKNDYPMNIKVPDASGQVVPTRVYRFHDAYAAEGVNVEAGVVKKPWAKQLSLRTFLTHYSKEIQHNFLMTFNPYGDVVLDEHAAGGVLRYGRAFGGRVSLDLVAGYAYRIQHYLDVGQCFYDWFAQCTKPREQPGERGPAQDQRYTEHGLYGRLNLEWRAHPQHSFRLSVAPTLAARTGDERRQANPDARDALSAERELSGIVSGVEYKAELFEQRLENALFFKDYLQILRSEEPLSNATFRRADRQTHRVGLGDALRIRFTDWLYSKASYEWATRLPRADEIFGNAFPVRPNLGLKPELSHNFNLGVTLNLPDQHSGAWRGEVNGFLRDASQLIVLVGDDQSSTYQNVYSARSLGVEASAGWTSQEKYVELDANFTYVDFRNTSSEGGFSANRGSRIPNRPYLFGNAAARLRLREVADARDELSLAWATRYVHQFFRGWENLGSDKHKLTIDAQLIHSLALVYLVRGDTTTLSFTGELQNLTDAPAFDFFGVPRPGRAFYFKATASL